MPRSAKNKTKAWRREQEIHMITEYVDFKNEAGEDVKTPVQVPYILKGRMLRDYRMRAEKAPAMPSGLLVNLMFQGGYVNIVSKDEVNPTDNIEPIVETV